MIVSSMPGFATTFIDTCIMISKRLIHGWMITDRRDCLRPRFPLEAATGLSMTMGVDHHNRFTPKDSSPQDKSPHIFETSTHLTFNKLATLQLVPRRVLSLTFCLSVCLSVPTPSVNLLFP